MSCRLILRRICDHMPNFRDHPRKRVVREQWDTPVLEWLHSRWRRKYFYMGLPGPEAIDIELWHWMIERVVAFEMESPRSRNPRKDLIALNKKLTLLNIPNAVYCGSMEEVLLWKKDYDGNALVLDEFVTLFNLDFCNAITGRIDTSDGTKRCLRFEALREIVTIQRSFFRRTGQNKFIMLITAFDSFHVQELQRFISNPDLPGETSSFIDTVLSQNPLPRTGYIQNTELLRVFVFSCMREYFHGQNVKSLFLPMVVYTGRNESTPMVHFTVVCHMEPQEDAQVVDAQSAGDFLQMDTVRAGDEGLTVVTELAHQAGGIDPVCYLRQFRMEEENI